MCECFAIEIQVLRNGRLSSLRCRSSEDLLPYNRCLLVAAVKILSCLANSIFYSYIYADKTSIEVCISSILAPIIYAQIFRDRLARSLKNGSHFCS